MDSRQAEAAEVALPASARHLQVTSSGEAVCCGAPDCRPAETAGHLEAGSSEEAGTGARLYMTSSPLPPGTSSEKISPVVHQIACQQKQQKSLKSCTGCAPHIRWA